MSLRRNIINLFISQSIAYVIPLLQLPYLARTLNTEGFGLYIFSYSIILFLSIITNYGLDIYFPKEMALNHNKKNKDNEYLTQSLIIKTFLLLPCTVILFFIYKLTNYYANKECVLFWIAASVFFNAYSLFWYFQGRETVYLHSRISITTKLISMILIFILVKQPNDIERVFSIIAFSNLATLAASLFFARKKYNIYFCKIKASDIFSPFKGGFEYFLSNLVTSMYSTIGVIVIGAFSGSLKQVAIYGAAHQLYVAGIYATSSTSIPLTPYMVRTENYASFFKITAFTIFISICGACIGWMYGQDILFLIYGPDLMDAKSVLDIFMFTIILSIIGIHLGFPALIPLGRANAVNYSTIYAGIIYLFTLLIMITFNAGITATAIALVYLICESITTCYRLAVFSKYYQKKINHKNPRDSLNNLLRYNSPSSPRSPTSGRDTNR